MPASAKTLFLSGILESRKGVYFDGSNTSNRILDVLEEKRPKIICIDELDKMARQFQEKLLNFVESGHIKVDQKRKQYYFQIKAAKIFAACYQITRPSRPLQSRFRRLHLPRYSEEQFLEVSAKVLPKLKIAHVIGKAVWDQRGDIRDVISIGRLVRKNVGPEEVERREQRGDIRDVISIGKFVRKNDGPEEVEQILSTSAVSTLSAHSSTPLYNALRDFLHSPSTSPYLPSLSALQASSRYFRTSCVRGIFGSSIFGGKIIVNYELGGKIIVIIIIIRRLHPYRPYFHHHRQVVQEAFCRTNAP